MNYSDGVNLNIAISLTKDNIILFYYKKTFVVDEFITEKPYLYCKKMSLGMERGVIYYYSYY